MVTMRRLGLALMGFLALGLSACGGGGGGGATTGPGGNSAFVIRNQSQLTICYVNISPSSDSNWGPDRLGPSEVISPGVERGWEFPAGSYDFQLLDCNRNELMRRQHVAFPPRDGLVLTFRRAE